MDLGARTVTEDVAERLRRRIHRGELGPGDRLPAERELAERLGVARVSLREAIKLLQASGYVVVRRGAHGGTFVTGLETPYENWLTRMRGHAGELDDILDYRIGLEARAASLAALRRNDADLTAAATAIRRLVDGQGRSSFRLADSAFHAAVAAAARNTRLESAIHYARGELFSPTDQLVYTAQVEACRLGHQRVYDAIAGREPDDAAAAMAGHIEHTRAELARLLFGGGL